jgi:hypothetical protein
VAGASFVLCLSGDLIDIKIFELRCNYEAIARTELGGRAEPSLATTRPSLFWGFMPTFLYRCPNTDQNVQGFTAEEATGDTYESITCLACRQLHHFVNPTTGKILGEDDDE